MIVSRPDWLGDHSLNGRLRLVAGPGDAPTAAVVVGRENLELLPVPHVGRALSPDLVKYLFL